MKRFLSVTIVLAWLVAFIAGCAVPQTTTTTQETTEPGTAVATQETTEAATTSAPVIDESKLPVLRVGSFPFRISFGLWYIMKNKLDVQNGFKIETVEVTNGAALNEAFGAGLLDVAEIGTAAAVNSAAVYGCKILAEISQGSGALNLFARADSDIAKATGNNSEYPEIIGSADTIRGKSIIFPVGSMAQIGVARYLKAFGLTLEDITMVNMNYAQGYQAFKGGESDIVAVFSPANYTAIKDGWVKLATLYDLKYDVKDVLIADPKALEDADKKAQITDLLKLIYEVNDMMAADEALQKTSLVEYYKEKGSDVDPEMLYIEIGNQYLLTSEMAKENIANLGSSVVTTAENYVEMGILDAAKIDVIKSCIDNSIAKEVLGLN